MKFIPLKDMLRETDFYRLKGDVPLSRQERNIAASEIRRIGADNSAFVFGTGRSRIENGRVVVTREIFPFTDFSAYHPRSLMSVGAFLAFLYRSLLNGRCMGWRGMALVSIEAAKTTPNLTDVERSSLVQNAVHKAHIHGCRILLDACSMKMLCGQECAKALKQPFIVRYGHFRTKKWFWRSP